MKTGHKFIVALAAMFLCRSINAQYIFEDISSRPDVFYIEMDGITETAALHEEGVGKYAAMIDDVMISLEYVHDDEDSAQRLRKAGLTAKPSDCMRVHIRMTNCGMTPFQPVRAGLKLGIDTYMDSYPQWLGKYFPTLLRCERTHFYGYLQSPSGRVIALASSAPVASWSLDYNSHAYQEPEGYWWYGHRVEAVNIDFLNALPLPQRHPQDLWHLECGESLEWTLYAVKNDSGERLEECLSAVAGIPMLRMTRTSYAPGETAEYEAITPGKAERRTLKMGSPGDCPVSCSYNGKTATGLLSAGIPWRRVMELARMAAMDEPQKAGSHVESWYGFYSAFIAARHFPDRELDSLLDARFEKLMPLLYGPGIAEPLQFGWRLQNTSSTVGMYVDRFEAYGRSADLDCAARLADWLISYSQKPSCAYANHWGNIYTSVIYVAKSILELAQAELSAGRTEDAFRHYRSAKAAIDQLVSADGDFNTEGEITFEDGMVSCSALQMGQLALMVKDFETPERAGELRRRYTDAMLRLLGSHDCLTQLRVPDSRLRGGTLRFWEAQYDVAMMPNMITSPHGWSAWRAYATFYAFLLTGEERWIAETFNAAGAFSELFDKESGGLRWAFVVDPYVRARQICCDIPEISPDSLNVGSRHPDLYPNRKLIVGEQYVDMVASRMNFSTCDNDVHEAFKFIGEAVLTNAFLIERPDGSLATYNCHVRRHGKNLYVTASEPQIKHLYASLTHRGSVHFDGTATLLPHVSSSQRL